MTAYRYPEAMYIIKQVLISTDYEAQLHRYKKKNNDIVKQVIYRHKLKQSELKTTRLSQSFQIKLETLEIGLTDFTKSNDRKTETHTMPAWLRPDQ